MPLVRAFFVLASSYASLRPIFREAALRSGVELIEKGVLNLQTVFLRNVIGTIAGTTRVQEFNLFNR